MKTNATIGAARHDFGSALDDDAATRAAPLAARPLTVLALALCWLAAGCVREPAPPADSGPRLVSLAPSLTEIVFAIGAGERLVGRTDVCNYPPAARRVAVAGSFGRPSLETILALRPTMVLTVDLDDERALDPLVAAGIAQRRIVCRRLDDIPGAIREVGELAAAAEQARVLADSLAAEVARLRAARGAAEAASAPTVFIEIWGDPLMTAGRLSFVSELVALAGGRNLGDELDGDYVTVSPEWVVRRDPDIVLCLYMAADTRAAARLAARAGWQHLRALREGRVYDGFDTDVLFRPGPRVLEGVESLRRALEAPGR